MTQQIEACAVRIRSLASSLSVVLDCTADYADRAVGDHVAAAVFLVAELSEAISQLERALAESGDA